MKIHESIESKHYRERAELFRGLRNLDRRSFLKLSALSAGLAAARAILSPQSFQLLELAQAAPAPGRAPLTVAYISDTHLHSGELNGRFLRAILRAVDDVNRLDPQPDFVLFGGDLAQLGGREELELGAEILGSLKAPVKMVAGEHDWYLDLGERWRELFGEPTYSFDHRGVHFVTLNSVHQRDFWTAHGLSPAERMQVIASPDHQAQSPFEVGAEQREWLRRDLAPYPSETPIVIFSHAPLYEYFRSWNFWTADAAEVHAPLLRFENVNVVHGHTHQLLTNRIGNISFHGMLSTAWPWPYAPEGLPTLTVPLAASGLSGELEGCGHGQLSLGSAAGKEGFLAEKLYRLWDRNPVSVRLAPKAGRRGLS